MNLLQMSFSGAIFIIAVVIIRGITINRLPKRTFLVLWGMVVVRLLLPFSVPFKFSVYSLMDQSTFHGTKIGEIPFTAQTEAFELIGETPQLPAGHTSSVSIWFVVWLAGMVLCIGFFTISYLRCRFEFQTSLPVCNDFINQWLRKHPLRRPISIRQSDRIFSPLTYGVFKPVILMPKNTDWENTEQLQYVLLHEYLHICRYDAVTKMLSTLALCIHWFNPFVWLMHILFNRDMELSCDESVVRLSGETSKSIYANVLIGMEAKKSGLMPLCNNFSKNAIEERIIAIMKIKKTSIFAVVIATGLIIVMATTFATSAANNTENEILHLEQSTDNKMIHVEHGTENDTIIIESLSLQPGFAESFGKHFFKKGDMISIDITWDESDTIYFSVDKELVPFPIANGAEDLGSSLVVPGMNETHHIEEDGEYYVFLGIRSTAEAGTSGIRGTIEYPVY